MNYHKFIQDSIDYCDQLNEFNFERGYQPFSCFVIQGGFCTPHTSIHIAALTLARAPEATLHLTSWKVSQL